jgi:hypothetical protein
MVMLRGGRSVEVGHLEVKMKSDGDYKSGTMSG